MAINREKLSFENQRGEKLAALLERPAKPRALALFAHCFTCSKDIAAATRISRALGGKGIGVLRFDFTGLGNSEGDFANTNFSSNVQDLLAAADAMRDQLEAPQILIGHSLGGAAVLAAAGEIEECRAVATIGAPSDPGHLRHLLEGNIEEIEAEGSATVTLAGRKFKIKKQFLEDISSQRLRSRLDSLDRALLILHSPLDNIVSIEEAAKIYKAARHPKSFISLDEADHLLSRKEDSEYVATVLSAWASRYLDPLEKEEEVALEKGVVRIEEQGPLYTQTVRARSHRIQSDEPRSVGGQDAGMDPYELLLAALGSCTAITLRMYANRKEWPLEQVSMDLTHQKIHAQDCAECETKEGKIDRMTRRITLKGNLSEKQRERLLEIANRCPVHRTLESENHILSELTD